MIYKEVSLVGLSTLITSLKKTSLFLLISGLILTLINFLFLAGYDFLGLQYLKRKLPFLTVFKISALSFAISNVAGHTYASGSALRYLLLKKFEFQKKEIFILVGFISLLSVFGLMIGFLLALFVKILGAIPVHFLHPFLFYLTGATCLLIFLFYFFKIVPNKRELKIKNIRLKAPSFSLSAKGIFIGLMDFLSLYSVFYLFLASNGDFHLLFVFPAFAFALVLAYLSQVPAGIGVFESLFLILYPHESDEKAIILTAFILFRVVYYIIPFCLAGIYLLIQKPNRENF
ncbi:MAG: UPF0104 family protein [Alphaproteobacteria bacterium]|nr:UPF0104 family protein [Alphaproteobacteria bacterium]